MSSFGGVDIPVKDWGIDFIVSSANKCIQGVPGFSFVIARRDLLEQSAGRARSLSLDLYDQWKTMEVDGKWRFTSPTHVVLAFAQAMKELKEEGGIEARSKRYRENNRLLIERMAEMGFRTYIDGTHQGPIITTFFYPEECRFTRWCDGGVDIISDQGGKTEGIKYFCDQYDISREEIMAFGDAENDIDMLRYAGIGVAMGNAEDTVRKCADYVTDSVDDGGIRNALKHFQVLN